MLIIYLESYSIKFNNPMIFIFKLKICSLIKIDGKLAGRFSDNLYTWTLNHCWDAMFHEGNYFSGKHN